MFRKAHHLLCALFGTLHTLLGVSASKLEDSVQISEADEASGHWFGPRVYDVVY